MPVEIPASLLPRDGRFGCGPAKVPPSAMAALGDSAPLLMGTSHRQAPVKKLVQRVRSDLSTLYDAPEGYEVVLGNGGSTLFWDMAVCSLIDRRSAHGVYGEFSGKFAKASNRASHLAEPAVFETDPGSVRLPEPTEGADVYAWAHNETSTGALAPVHRLGSGSLHRVGTDDALVVIDGTSAAGGVPVDLSETDVYYFAPQKGFASDGGLWVAFLSPRAIERAGRIAASERWIPEILNLQVAYDNSVRNQTLNTPAVATLFLMAEQLRWLLEHGGMAFAVQRTTASAAALYGWAEAQPVARPFVSEPEYRSPVVATIDFDASVDALQLAAHLRANGIVDTESYRKLGRNQLRVGMFPAVAPDDVTALTECIDWLLPRVSTI